jgi:hypothetical protein
MNLVYPRHGGARRRSQECEVRLENDELKIEAQIDFANRDEMEPL